MKSFFLWIVFVILFLGCGNSPESSESNDIEVNSSSAIPFSVVASDDLGAENTLEGKRIEVVSDAAIFESLFHALNPQADVPAIDFSQNMVVIATLGRQSYGASVAVSSIGADADGNYLVQIVTTPHNSSAVSSMSAPYQIVQFEGTGFRHFVIEEKIAGAEAAALVKEMAFETVYGSVCCSMSGRLAGKEHFIHFVSQQGVTDYFGSFDEMFQLPEAEIPMIDFSLKSAVLASFGTLPNLPSSFYYGIEKVREYEAYIVVDVALTYDMSSCYMNPAYSNPTELITFAKTQKPILFNKRLTYVPCKNSL